MMDGLGIKVEESQVVVLAGSALRSAPLETLANALRSKGARVEVVAGVDRRRVDLLKLSFRHRGHASYLLLGGPALREDVLGSIATELEANGVPAHRISAGPCPWEDDAAVLQHANQRLQSLGTPVAATIAPPLTAVPKAPPPPSVGPMPPTPNLPPPRRPIPSTSVPALSASSSTLTQGRLSRVPRAAWIAGGVAALGALVLAISLGTSSDDTETPSQSESEPAVAAVASPFVSAERPASAVEQPASADPADPEDDAQEDDAEEAPGEAIDVEALAEPFEAGEEDDEAPVALPQDDGDLVYAALRSQSIRALDILLVSPPATKQRGRRQLVAKLNFEGARAHCKALDVDGVVGWRLPDVGEAQWLSRSNMIRNGVYWTSTKADAFGDERVTWNPRSKRMRATGQRWRGGRVVCVRFSNPDDPGPR